MQQGHPKRILTLQKAQIILYGILNLYSKAVKLALNCGKDGDIELAKEYANKPADAKTKKKLWMKIAKHLFRASKEADSEAGGANGRKKVNVEEALRIIRAFDVLKVEDLLDLFPEKAKVEEMKAHLCSCLDDYEGKIKGLRMQIEKHSANTEQLRTQKRSQRNKNITINPGQTCDICFGSVFDNREFFVYPCGHAFHRECIRAYLQSYVAGDPKIGVVIQQLQANYEEIDKIKMSYLLAGSVKDNQTFEPAPAN